VNFVPGTSALVEVMAAIRDQPSFILVVWTVHSRGWVAWKQPSQELGIVSSPADLGMMIENSVALAGALPETYEPCGLNRAIVAG
jgi:hypothetical protein